MSQFGSFRSFGLSLVVLLEIASFVTSAILDLVSASSVLARSRGRDAIFRGSGGDANGMLGSSFGKVAWGRTVCCWFLLTMKRCF